jgi:hypothetical protein
MINFGNEAEIAAMPSPNSAAPSQPVPAVRFPRNNVGGIQLPVVSVAQLPACSSSADGTLIGVFDSSVNTFDATIAGNGKYHVMAYCDGSNWTVH